MSFFVGLAVGALFGFAAGVAFAPKATTPAPEATAVAPKPAPPAAPTKSKSKSKSKSGPATGSPSKAKAPPPSLEPTATGAPVVVTRGRSVLVSLPENVRSVAAGEPRGLAAMRPGPNRTFSIGGMVVGETSFTVVTTDDERIYYSVTITAEDSGESEDRQVVTLAVGGTHRIELAAPPKFTQTTDPAIATASDGADGAVVLTGVAPGLTDVTIRNEDGTSADLNIVVE